MTAWVTRGPAPGTPGRRGPRQLADRRARPAGWPCELTRLAALGRGVPVGDAPSDVVPIVPAAILFDLGRGGVFGNYPGTEAGEAAFDAALAPGARTRRRRTRRLRQRGGRHRPAGGAAQRRHRHGQHSALKSPRPTALCPTRPGRSASRPGRSPWRPWRRSTRPARLPGCGPASCTAQFGLPGEFDWVSPPARGELAGAAGLLAADGLGAPPRPRPLNTTIGVIACPPDQSPRRVAAGRATWTSFCRPADADSDANPARSRLRVDLLVAAFDLVGGGRRVPQETVGKWRGPASRITNAHYH